MARVHCIFAASVSVVVILGALVFTVLGGVCFSPSTLRVCDGISHVGSKTFLGLGITMILVVCVVDIVLAALWCRAKICGGECCQKQEYVLDVEEGDRSD